MRQPSPAKTITDDFIAEVVARLQSNKRVRRILPAQGRLHIDRQVPFLVLYRRTVEGRKRRDAGTLQMVLGESSYLIAAGAPEHEEQLMKLVSQIADVMSDIFGAFLLLEIWAGPETENEAEVAPFRIFTPRRDDSAAVIEHLETELRAMSLPDKRVEVEISHGPTAPPLLSPLITTSQAKRDGVLMVGLEVPPIYRDAQNGAVFPAMLRVFRRQLSRALQKTFFEFMHVQTTGRPVNYQMLGRRAVVKSVWQADEQLAEVNDAFNLLLAVTPLNAAAAYHDFKQSKWQRAPSFHYRLLPIDPDLLKRKLYNIPLENVEDPGLAHLFRDKRLELDRQITLLEDRDTPRFLPCSLQLYGGVKDPLFRIAQELLKRIRPPEKGDDENSTTLDASQFAARAREEIDYYRAMAPELAAKVEVREDVHGLLVTRGNLLVGQHTRINERRAEALLQHEVGTHVLTYYNGKCQPLRQLYAGLPNYDVLQEGTATLAEFLSGGLHSSRLRYLAARVVAVRHLTDGASFVDTFRELHLKHQCSRRSAYSIVMRVYRGGGYTKDAVYLRGLVRLLNYLKNDGAIEPLFIGKISADYIALVEELQWREVLKPIPLWPRYLDKPDAQARLQRVREGLTVFDLIE